MTYSSYGIISLLVLLIVNNGAFSGRPENNSIPSHVSYRHFLTGTVGLMITDILWGILYECRYIKLLYADTMLFFLFMALCVLLWARYVVNYLGDNGLFDPVLLGAARLYLVFKAVILLVNLFRPVLFRFDENGAYHTGDIRNISFIIQMFLFFASSVCTIAFSSNSAGRQRIRYFTISLFGITMMISIASQMAFPMMPFYTLGLLIGTCLLHTFILEDEKEERHKELEELINKEKLQNKELGSVRHIAYSDALTGVKNKHAYDEDVEVIESRIKDGSLTRLCVVVFDVNNLKKVNDTMGHEEGDNLIRNACTLICKQFAHSPVYRIGGDEFVTILEGEDYTDRLSLIDSFNWQIDDNLISGSVVVACGMEDFNPLRDKNYSSVFERADGRMYIRKRTLKEKESFFSHTV